MKKLAVEKIDEKIDEKIEKSFKVRSAHTARCFKKNDILVGAYGNQLLALIVVKAGINFVKCEPYDLNILLIDSEHPSKLIDQNKSEFSTFRSHFH